MKFWVILLDILTLLGIFPAIMMAAFSPMLFDAPNASKSKYTWALFFLFISLPICMIVCNIMSWGFVWLGEYWVAFKIALVPLLPLALILLAFALIMIFQNGNFAPNNTKK